MTFMTALTHLTLIGASCYGLYALDSTEHPYAYTAASFCLIHGIMSVVKAFEDNDDCGRAYTVSTGVVNVIPLPLANIEFYLQSSQSGIALVHALSLILLLYDVMGNLGDDWNHCTEMVKDLSLLGNMGSATYMGLQQENYFYVGAAVAAGVARYGATFVDFIIPCLGPHVDTLGKAGVIGLLTYSLTDGKTA